MNKKILVTIVLILSLCAGCSKDKRDDVQDKLGQVQEENSGQAESTDLDANASYTYPETVSYVSNPDIPASRTTIDAKVIAETTEDIAVYGLSFVPIDDALVKSYADKLFDNGEYEVIKPFSICSEEELNAERNHAALVMEYYGEGDRTGQKYYKLPCPGLAYAPEDVINSIDHELSSYEESDYVELAEGQLLYEEIRESYEDTPEDSTTTRRSKTRLRGMVDGEEWDMSVQYVEPVGGAPYGVISMSNVYSDTFVWEYGSISDMNTMFFGENVVDIDEARQDAINALSKLGFEELDNIYTCSVVSVDSCTLIEEGYYRYEGEKNNGYCFVFARRYGNLDVGYVAHGYGGLTITGVEGEELGNFQEYIYVTVTDDGIYNISFSTGYEITEKLSDESKLMDFDYINDAAIKFIEERPITYKYIGTIELKYVAIYYDDEGYALVPVWIYYDSMEGTIAANEPQARFGVNALDGSIVNFENYDTPFDTEIY